MIKNYIEYKTMKSKNDYKIIVFISLKTNNNSRILSQLKCDSIYLDHFDKNNILWLYNKNNKIINKFNLTDYEVKKINDKNKFIKYNNLIYLNYFLR